MIPLSHRLHILFFMVRFSPSTCSNFHMRHLAFKRANINRFRLFRILYTCCSIAKSYLIQTSPTVQISLLPDQTSSRFLAVDAGDISPSPTAKDNLLKSDLFKKDLSIRKSVFNRWNCLIEASL